MGFPMGDMGLPVNHPPARKIMAPTMFAIGENGMVGAESRAPTPISIGHSITLLVEGFSSRYLSRISQPSALHV